MYEVTEELKNRQHENREKFLESQRRQIAHELTLPENATWEEFIKAERERNKYIASYYLDVNSSASWRKMSDALKKLLIMEQGLPDGASWDDIIYAKCKEMDRVDQLLEEGYTWEQIRMITTEENRKRQAISLDLPKNASWVDIDIARWKKHTRKEAIRLGLPEDSHICDVNKEIRNEKRKEEASYLHLPENATWDEINNAKQEINRKRYALFYGLPENATWKEIRLESNRRKKKTEKEVVSKEESKEDKLLCRLINSLKHEKERKTFASCLGLPESASWEEINKLRDEFREDEASSLDLVDRSSWNEIRYSEYTAETKTRRALAKNISRAQVSRPWMN